MARTPEQRKAETIAVLKTKGLPFVEHLPALEGEGEVRLRPAEEVLRRMRGTFVYFMRGQAAMADAPVTAFRKRLNPLGAWDEVSPAENLVVNALKPTPQQIISSSWALEAVFVMQWALHFVPRLPWPAGLCDMDETTEIVKSASSAKGLKLRTAEELLDAADLHYRLLWACRQATLEGKPEPEGVSGSVVFERRRALSWMLDATEDWDSADVSS